MFGLMKNHAGTPAQQDRYRHHYCGLCKSIGSQYDQKSRLFLNLDLVFMAEILSHITEAASDKWDASFHSKRCFKIPKEGQIPPHLSYAADVNVFLANLKVSDHIDDDYSLPWRALDTVFDKPFIKAKKRLVESGIDIVWIQEKLAENNLREGNNENKITAVDQLINWHSQPTAEITAYLFQNGLPAEKEKDWSTIMYQVGYDFGALIYALDAWRDLEKDIEEENFNPLLASELPLEEAKDELQEYLWSKVADMKINIDDASLSEEVKATIISRLNMNLGAELGTSAVCSGPNVGISESSVPVMFRRVSTFFSAIGSWFNPLRPTKFAISYVVILFVFFNDYLFAVERFLRKPGGSSFLDMGTVGALIGGPVVLYLIFKKFSESNGGKRSKRKLRRLARKLKRKLKRAERRAKRKDEDGKKKKLKWWHWVLIVLGALILIGALNGDCEPDVGCGECNPDCGGGGDSCCSGGSGGGSPRGGSCCK